jgi:hypothetical protein
MRNWSLRTLRVPNGYSRAWARAMKSVQYFSITITAGNTSNTATLSPAVVADNSILLWLGQNFDQTNTNNDNSNGSLAFTNGTTITATRVGTGDILTVKGVVVEFYPGVVKTVQAGTITVTTSTTATLGTAVNTAKSIVFHLGNTSTDTSGASSVEETALTLTDSTTVTATRGVNSTTAVVSYRVVEFL